MNRVRLSSRSATPIRLPSCDPPAGGSNPHATTSSRNPEGQCRSPEGDGHCRCSRRLGPCWEARSSGSVRATPSVISSQSPIVRNSLRHTRSALRNLRRGNLFRNTNHAAPRVCPVRRLQRPLRWGCFLCRFSPGGAFALRPHARRAPRNRITSSPSFFYAFPDPLWGRYPPTEGALAPAWPIGR